mgnify:CR=1 FL=1
MIEKTTFLVKITKYKNNLRWGEDFLEPITILHEMTLLKLLTRNYKHGCGFIYQIEEEVFIC